MLVNLRLMGLIHQDLSRLKEYCERVATATHTEIPVNYPVLGRDAFRTATGVHAAAIIKAFRKGDTELVNAVYSGVPAHLFGLDQIIEIGPMSGKSNVIYWLEKRGRGGDEATGKPYSGSCEKVCARVDRRGNSVTVRKISRELTAQRKSAR